MAKTTTNNNHPRTLKLLPTLISCALDACIKVTGDVTISMSDAIRQCLVLYLVLPKKLQNLSKYGDTRLHELIPEPEKRLMIHKPSISVRIPQAFFEYILEISNGIKEDISETVTKMMAITIIYIQKVNIFDLHLLRIWGNKWDERMIEQIRQITDSKKWSKSFETCAGALAIHANFKLAEEEIISDIDSDKVNVYRAIQKDPHRLIAELMKYSVDENTFNLLRQADVDKQRNVDFELAARYIYLNLNSWHFDDNKFKQKATPLDYYKTIAAIYSLHKRLRNTKIKTKDIFKTLDTYGKEGKTLAIVDPPYINTGVYESNLTLKQHKQLAKKIRRLKKRYEMDFIYFCRVTVGHSKANTSEKSDKKHAEENFDLKCTIDDLYWGYEFYYIDVPLDRGIIERIITSFPFEGATLYGNRMGSV